MTILCLLTTTSQNDDEGEAGSTVKIQDSTLIPRLGSEPRPQHRLYDAEYLEAESHLEIRNSRSSPIHADKKTERGGFYDMSFYCVLTGFLNPRKCI